MATKKQYTPEFKAQIRFSKRKKSWHRLRLSTVYNRAVESMEENCLGQPRLCVCGRTKSSETAENSIAKNRPPILASRKTNHSTRVDQKNLASTRNRNERLAMAERENRKVPLRTQAHILSLSRSSLFYMPTEPSDLGVKLKHRFLRDSSFPRRLGRRVSPS